MEQVREQEQAISAEQAADLAALQAVAAEQGAAQQGAAQQGAAAQVQEQAGADLAGELSAVAGIALAVLSVPYPSLAPIWTEQAVQGVAKAAAAVCEKHGWLSGGFMAGYGAEMALLATAGPLVVASYGAVKADTAARREKPEKQPEALPPVAGPVQVPDVPQPERLTVHVGTVQA
jgi:hypothetical protein